MPGKAELLERERRWSLPVALLGMLAVVLFVAATILAGSAVSANEEAEALREVDANSGKYLIAAILRALGSALLAAPLVYLFRAVDARAPRDRKSTRLNSS